MRFARLSRSLTGLALALVSVGAQAQVDVTASAGTPAASYPQLKLAFDAINAGTHQGRIAIGLSANTTETDTAALNSGTLAPAAYTSVTIRPTGAPRTISGTITGAIIKLNGADNVTIDGRLAGAGRNLTVQNDSSATGSAAIWLASQAAENGASTNVIRNLEIAAGVTDTNTGSTFGIIMCGGVVINTNGIDNDNNQFVFNRIIRARYGIVTRGTTTDLNIAPIITDNIIGPAGFGADQIGKVGIFLQADTGAIVSRNLIQFVGGTAATLPAAGADRFGIAIGSEFWGGNVPIAILSNNYTVTKNVVHDIIDERNFSAVGINLATDGTGSATNNLVANNFVYNIRSNSTMNNQTVGIGIQGGHTDRVVFNSISMIGDVDGTLGGTSSFGSGIRINVPSGASHANLLLSNNNILLNLRSSSNPAVRFYAVSGMDAGYSFGTGGQNNNNYYLTPANLQLLTGGLGTTGSTATTSFATLANWKTAYAVAQDAASIQANPLYVSATDLHIASGSPSQNVGAPAGVIDDIDFQSRPGGAAFDIGADEIGGTAPPANDLRATSFVDPPSGATKPVNMVFAPQASFTNTGTATQTNVQVRYRIRNAMTVVVYNQTALIPSLVFNDSAIVTFPPLSLSAVGSYSIFATAELASDTVPANNEISEPLSVAAPFSGTYTVGSGGNFATLTNTGGVFQALNGVGANGNITLNIVSDLIGETGANALNQIAGGFSVRIQPVGGRTIIGNSAAAALIDLNGADGVTIDGLNAGGNSLLIRNTSHGVIRMINDASGNIVRNLTVETATGFTSIRISGGSVTGNDDNVVTRNVLRARTDVASLPSIGVESFAFRPGTLNSNLLISDNLISEFSQAGILVHSGTENVTITGNTLSQVNTRSSTVVGIRFSGSTGTNLISRNTIRDFANSGTFTTDGMVFQGNSATTVSGNRIRNMSNTAGATGAIIGIGFLGEVGTAASITVVNNMVTIAPANTSNQGIRGIYDFGITGNTFVADHNSVFIGGVSSGMLPSWGLLRRDASATAFTARNNLAFNGRSGAGNHFAGGDQSPNAGSFVSNFNLFVGTGTTAASFMDRGTQSLGTPVSFATWQAGPPARDANSIAGTAASFVPSDIFVDVATGDLHLKPTAGVVLNGGTPLPGVTTDFDNDPRSTTTPDIGADEFVSPSYTVGGNVTGLAGTGLVLQNNLGDNLPISANGAFNFATPVIGGATYSVTVLTQPGSPAQSCFVTNGSGTIGSANVTNVAVACSNNSAPTIAPVAVTRRAGDPVTAATIANVNDAEDAENTLAIRINGGASAMVNGVTVSGLVVNAAGVVSANVIAACGASTATFIVRVTDSGSLFAEATLTVTVNANLAPVLTYTSPQSVILGQALAVNPATGPTDTGPISSIVLLSQGTYTGGISVNNTTGVVILTAAAPPGTHTLTVRAVDSCLSNTDAPITLTVTPSANLSIVKQSSLALLAGGMIQYTITASNSGPSAVTGARVEDAFAAQLSGAAWTCAGTNSGTCTASGTGNIDQLVNLPVGSTVVFSVTANVAQPLPASISNTATITPPAAVLDPASGNNTSTVLDQLVIFRNGFENLGALLQTTEHLPLARAGIIESLMLSREAAGLAAVDAHPVEFASFNVDGTIVVVQARRLGGELQVRLLQRHPNGNWTVGAWSALGTFAIYLEWSNQGPAGTSNVSTRLRIGA